MASWLRGAGAVNDYFADAVLVYMLTGDGVVRLAALAAAKTMAGGQRASAVNFARVVADDMRTQASDEEGADAVQRLENLASEISLRDWTMQDVIHERRALAGLDKEFERALGNWRGYCDSTVFQRRFPHLFKDRKSAIPPGAPRGTVKGLPPVRSKNILFWTGAFLGYMVFVVGLTAQQGTSKELGRLIFECAFEDVHTKPTPSFEMDCNPESLVASDDAERRRYESALGTATRAKYTPLGGVQNALAVNQRRLSFLRKWTIPAALSITGTFALPWLWYFLLDRIRELSGAVSRDPQETASALDNRKIEKGKAHQMSINGSGTILQGNQTAQVTYSISTDAPATVGGLTMQPSWRGTFSPPDAATLGPATLRLQSGASCQILISSPGLFQGIGESPERV